MAQRYSDTWHAAEATEERAWLDQFTRAQRITGAPWASPDANPPADWADHLSRIDAPLPV